MFMLDNKPLALDTAFTHNDIQYPANWLRHATADEKAAIGVTEVADPEPYDDRFYWGVGAPKQLEDKTETVDGVEYKTKGLKSIHIDRVKDTANKLLQPSDWLVLRQLFRGVGMSHIVEDYRNAVIDECNRLQTVIAAVTTVEELAAVQPNWPVEGA